MHGRRSRKIVYFRCVTQHHDCSQWKKDYDATIVNVEFG